MTQQRPALTSSISGQELLRWYWLLVELKAFARSIGVATTGGKAELTARLVARLDGKVPPRAVRRPRPAAPLTGPLTAATVLPDGQRCTQQLREYFISVIGPTFHFDGAMRAFIDAGASQTLGAAVRHWYESRDSVPTTIAPQFELNAFLRAWHAEHPGCSHEQAVRAWKEHRTLPVEARNS